jgi:hypothetical protein
MKKMCAMSKRILLKENPVGKMEVQLDKDELVCNLINGRYDHERLASLKELDLSNRGLSSLPEDLLGEHFESLETINLSHNMLTWVTGRFCSEREKVTTLDLSHNYLVSMLKNFFPSLKWECLFISKFLQASLYNGVEESRSLPR